MNALLADRAALMIIGWNACGFSVLCKRIEADQVQRAMIGVIPAHEWVQAGRRRRSVSAITRPKINPINTLCPRY